MDLEEDQVQDNDDKIDSDEHDDVTPPWHRPPSQSVSLFLTGRHRKGVSTTQLLF